MLYRFENNRILPKNMRLKMKSTKTKNYVKNDVRYTTLKNDVRYATLKNDVRYAKKSFLMVYVGTYGYYENIKIKL